MECKFKGVNRIKLFISGRKDFLYFDLPKNSRVESLKSVIGLMYNLDPKSFNLFQNNIPVDDYKGKTLEQISRGLETNLILMFKNPNNTLDTSRSNNHSKSPGSHSRNVSGEITDRVRTNSNRSGVKNGLYSNKNTSINFNNITTNTANGKNFNNVTNSSIISDSSYHSNSQRRSNSTLTPQINTNNAMTKSNYIFKKDLQNLQKETEFIQKNTLSLEDCEFFKDKSDDEDKQVKEKTSRFKILEDIFEEINSDLNKLKVKVVRQIDETKRNGEKVREVFSTNIKNLRRDLDNYNEELGLFFGSYNSFINEVKDKDIEELNYAKVTSKTKYLWQCISDLRVQYFAIAKKIADINKVKTDTNQKDYLKVLKLIGDNIKKHLNEENENANKSHNNNTHLNRNPSEIKIKMDKNLVVNAKNINNSINLNFNFNQNSINISNITKSTPNHSVDKMNVITHVDIPIMTIKENSNIVYLYNSNDNSTTQIEVTFPGGISERNVFFWNSRVCQLKNQLYVTGGHDDYNNGVKNCYLFDSSSPSPKHYINEVKNMNWSHWGHSIIYVPPKFIFIISGSYTKKCEFYDTQKKSWSNLSEINTWRMDSTPFLYNGMYLYIFGGWNNSVKSKDPFVDKIERIKLFSPINENMIMTTNKWELVKLSSNTSLIKKTCMGLIKTSENKILLLGGDTSDYLKETFYDHNNTNLLPGLGASKIKYHKSICEVKINYLGGCDIELLKTSTLEIPSCFTINKHFMSIGVAGDVQLYGCFNHLHEFSVIEQKEGCFQPRKMSSDE